MTGGGGGGAHCGLDLHFPGDECCEASLHVSLGHVEVFCGEMSIQVICPFSNLVLAMKSQIGHQKQS